MRVVTRNRTKHHKRNSNNDICALFRHLKHNNLDESIHFIMGRNINNMDIVCDGDEFEPLMNENTFFRLDEAFLENSESMESIFDITCPAYIEVKEFGGNLNLGNHDQWIDTDV